MGGFPCLWAIQATRAAALSESVTLMGAKIGAMTPSRNRQGRDDYLEPGSNGPPTAVLLVRRCIATR